MQGGAGGGSPLIFNCLVVPLKIPGITDSPAPYTFTTEEVKEVIVLQGIVPDNGKIVLSPHALAKFQFPHDHGILEYLHVVNSHERHLLRVVTSELRSPEIIKVRIGRIMPDQHSPERRR